VAAEVDAAAFSGRSGPRRLAAGRATAAARTATQRTWRWRAGARRRRRSPRSPAATIAGACPRALSTKVEISSSIVGMTLLLALVEQSRQLGQLLGRQVPRLDQAQHEALGRAPEHPAHQVGDGLAGGLGAADGGLVDVGPAGELAPD